MDTAAAVGLPATPPPAANAQGAGSPVPPGSTVNAPKRAQPSTTRQTSPPSSATSSTSAAPTTTAAPAAAAELPAGDNPVVGSGHQAAGAHHAGGNSSGRAVQVALAVGLLGVTGLGVSLGLLRLRGGAAP